MNGFGNSISGIGWRTQSDVKLAESRQAQYATLDRHGLQVPTAPSDDDLACDTLLEGLMNDHLNTGVTANPVYVTVS